MSITLKSLIFILLIGSVAFWIANKFINTNLISKKEFNGWRNIWFVFQILAFTAPNIWIFYSGVLLVCTFLIPKLAETRVSTYCFLLGSLPLLQANISGFGITNYLFTFDFTRALSIFILLPIFFILMQNNPKQLRLFSLPADKFIVAFFLLVILLNFRDDTFTNGLRFFFIRFIDFFIPYYVISRSITNIKQFNKVLFALFLSICLSISVGLFEAAKDWHIYNHLVQHLQGSIRLIGSEVRGGVLRASATFVSPITLGFVSTIGFGLYLYLSPILRNINLKKLLPIYLILGLWVTGSRGPWVGFAILCLVYIWTGKEKIKYFSSVLVGLIVSLPLLLFTAYGRTFIDLLPFIGTIRSETVEYRERLGEMAYIVVQRSPWFGSTTYIDTPEMQSMKQSSGAIDIVNNYIQVALAYGITGLALFASIFIVLLWQIYKSTKYLPKKETDLIRLGRSLFSILFAVALILYTVSSVGYIPHYYWVLFGLSSSYIYISKQTMAKHVTP